MYHPAGKAVSFQPTSLGSKDNSGAVEPSGNLPIKFVRAVRADQSSNTKGLSKATQRLKKIIRPEGADQAPQLERREVPMEMEFGFKYLHVYNKHVDGLQVQDCKYNPTIKGFVSYSEKQIRVWTPEKYTDMEIEGKTLFSAKFFDMTGSNCINCLTYSKQYFIYLIVSTDFKMHVFNESLHYAGYFPLRTRMVNFVDTIDNKSQIITAGIDGCFIYQFTYEGRYQPKQSLILDPEADFFDGYLKLATPLEKMPVWIKGQKFVKDRQVIVNWCQQVLTFHNLDGSLIYHFRGLVEAEDCVTDVLLCEQLKCFITASNKGQIQVWKYWQNKQLLHKFEGQKGKILSLQSIDKQPDLILSGSLDSSIRILSLTKYQELYIFKLQQGLANLHFLNHQYFVCIYQNNQIKVGKLNRIANNFKTTNNPIRQIIKCYKNEQDQIGNRPSHLLQLYQNNSMQVSVVREKNGKTHYVEACIIYPPPDSENIEFVDYCMNLQKIVVLLNNGRICLYSIVEHIEEPADPEVKEYKDAEAGGNESENSQSNLQESLEITQQSSRNRVESEEDPDSPPADVNCESVLESVFDQRQIMDADKRKLNQRISSIILGKAIPLKIDCEIYEDTKKEKLIEEMEQQKMKWPEGLTHRFLLLGLDRGSVIFLEIDKLNRIYARFSVHQDPVLHLCEVQGEGGVFVSICRANQIITWNFEGHKFNVINHNNLYRPVQEIKSVGTMIMIGFEMGDVQLFSYSELHDKLVFLKTSNQDQHEKELTFIDCFQGQKLFLTSCNEGFVKVWNVKKQLIRSIKFPEPINCVTFLNEDSDLLVGHVNKLSTISSQSYQLHSRPERVTPSSISIMSFINQSQRQCTNQFFHQLSLAQVALRSQAAVKISKKAKHVHDGQDCLVDDCDKVLKKQTRLGPASGCNLNQGIRPVIKPLTNDLEESESSDLNSVKSQSIDSHSSSEYDGCRRLKEIKQEMTKKVEVLNKLDQEEEDAQSNITVKFQPERTTTRPDFSRSVINKSTSAQSLKNLRQVRNGRPQLAALNVASTSSHETIQALHKQLTTLQNSQKETLRDKQDNKESGAKEDEEAVVEEEKQVIDLKELSKSYMAARAIPQWSTDQNYKVAVSRQLHRNRKNMSEKAAKMTRQEHTTERIRRNVEAYNSSIISKTADSLNMGNVSIDNQSTQKWSNNISMIQNKYDGLQSTIQQPERSILEISKISICSDHRSKIMASKYRSDMQSKRSYNNQGNQKDDAMTGIGDQLPSQAMFDTTIENSKNNWQPANDDLTCLPAEQASDEATEQPISMKVDVSNFNKVKAFDPLQGLNQITLTQTDIFNKVYVSFLDEDEIPKDQMANYKALGAQKKLQNAMQKKVNFTSHGLRTSAHRKNLDAAKTRSQKLPMIQQQDAPNRQEQGLTQHHFLSAFASQDSLKKDSTKLAENMPLAPVQVPQHQQPTQDQLRKNNNKSQVNQSLKMMSSKDNMNSDREASSDAAPFMMRTQSRILKSKKSQLRQSKESTQFLNMFAASRNQMAPGQHNTSSDFRNNKSSDSTLSLKFYENVVENINKRRFLVENTRSMSNSKIENMLLASQQYVKQQASQRASQRQNGKDQYRVSAAHYSSPRRDTFGSHMMLQNRSDFNRTQDNINVRFGKKEAHKKSGNDSTTLGDSNSQQQWSYENRHLNFSPEKYLNRQREAQSLKSINPKLARNLATSNLSLQRRKLLDNNQRSKPKILPNISLQVSQLGVRSHKASHNTDGDPYMLKSNDTISKKQNQV